MSIHEIDELDKTGLVLSLSPAERRAVARVTDRIGVEWRADESARLYSRGYVGSVALSQEMVFSVATKVPIANVLLLASLAYRTLPIPPALGDTLLDSQEPVSDWLAVLLIAELQSLLRNGLRQGYVEIEDTLPYVRGRLRLEAATQWSRPGSVFCEFADFLSDIPENRVIRATLEVLATQPLLPGLHLRVEDLLRSFQGVSFSRPTRKLLDACRITRLNQHYRASLELCRLFLEQAGLELEPGEVATPAFFFPMELVFQEAVASLLKERLPHVSRQSGKSYKPVSGEPARTLSFTPDIIVGTPPQLVADTKYARPEVPNRYGGLSYRNNDVYQAVFYALSFSCPGLLIYPRVDRDIDVTFEIEGVPISIVTVDLQEAGLPGLESLVTRVATFVNPIEAA